MDLVVALLKKKIVPTKKVHEINAILANAFHEENPEADGAWSEDFETVFDVVTQGEGKDMVQYFEDVGKTQEKKTCTPKQGPNAKPGKRRPAPTWTAPPNPKVSDGAVFLEEHRPPLAAFKEDAVYGRWHVVRPGRKPKSVSWTKRGIPEAVKVALHTAWTFHKDSTDVLPPWDLRGWENSSLRQCPRCSSQR
eukprot:6828136-Pyramimonas_sp.AAC.1